MFILVLSHAVLPKVHEILTNELAETFLICAANLSIILYFYNSIFGSQIYLLKILNSHKPDGLNENRIEAYFNDIAQKYPDFFATWTCEMYLNFLRQSILITTNKNNFCITEFGVDFLASVGWAESPASYSRTPITRKHQYMLNPY